MAGLAAFASKQVGCGLLHAAHAIERIQAEEDAQQDLRDSRRDWGLFTKDQMAPQHQLLREYQARDAQNPVPLDVWLAGDVQSVVQQQFQHVYDMMALGNTTLFLDIFPLHAFYKKRGLQELKTCLKHRAGIYGHPKFHQVMVLLGRFKDSRRPDEERYMITLAIASPWVQGDEE